MTSVFIACGGKNSEMCSSLPKILLVLLLRTTCDHVFCGCVSCPDIYTLFRRCHRSKAGRLWRKWREELLEGRETTEEVGEELLEGRESTEEVGEELLGGRESTEVGSTLLPVEVALLVHLGGPAFPL